MELQRQFFDMLQASQYWSLEEMRNHQRHQLGQLLRHAKANTAFYRSRLDPVFRSDGEIDWDRWGEIPILKRKDLLESRPAMLAENAPAGHGETMDFSSSGSSGPQVTITFNGLASLAAQAALFRGMDWHGVDWSKKSVTLTEGGAGQNSKINRTGPWGPLWDTAARWGENFPFFRPIAPEEILDFMLKNGVSYLRTRPRSAQEIAILAMQRNVKCRLDGIFTTGAAVTDDARRDCLEAFGCDPVSGYSAVESSSIAFQCPTGKHLHVNSEIVLFEVLDDNDAPCAPGEMGRVVVTPFYYTTQPVIRYELGDLAVMGGGCACGRGLPVIERIAGRTIHLFRFPDGKVVAPTIPRSGLMHLKASHWQIAQIAPLKIEVRYVPKVWNETGDEDAVVKLVREHVHAHAVVSFKRVEQIKPTSGGKYVEYLCEIQSS